VNKKDSVVIYHANCADGFCSAWIASKHLDADFVPASYGDPPPDVAGKHVYILDFSYPYNVLLELAKKAVYIVLCDHHKTAIEELITNKSLPCSVQLYLDNAKSGAQLTWDYFKATPYHWLVNYVADRDLWKWELPQSREVSAAISSYAQDFANWDTFDLETLKQEGKSILRAQQQIINRLVASATMDGLFGYNVPVVNTPVFQSEVAGKLAEDHTFAACYVVQGNKKLWSLRSKGDFDVSTLAKSAGGGGHRNAAGFEEEL
jgi:oligoribonuclease NrnB/cAMP/cGMP phosphodiesterase (DHH superfamily)